MKGVQFRNHRIVGDILELTERYRDEGADELVFYDITASPEDRQVDRTWIDRIAKILDIPFCVAGGIRSIADAESALNRGADKISINSPALADPALIDALAKRFGSQCVVVGVDSSEYEDGWQVHQFTGDPKKTITARSDTLKWIKEAESRGAGEIVLNCMNQDGVRQGYDCRQLKAARSTIGLPLVASGGAGTPQHFADVFDEAGVSAALAASVFHSGEIRIPDLKNTLHARGIPVRLIATKLENDHANG